MLLCEPNVSEGRDLETREALADRIRASPDVRLIHVSSDPDHHRMVLAYLGEDEAVLDATRGLATAVLERVDLRTHRGEHPRVGALDVVPFVGLDAAGRRGALGVCRRFGAWLGARGVPVWYYEQAATRPERRALPRLRRGGFEGLAARLEDPAERPDEGPSTPHPTAGASIVGVRGPLVRFNVNLATHDLDVARSIARTIRESSGGIPYVRALGIALRRRGTVQVSMNLTRYRETPILAAYRAVIQEAERYGVEVAGTELIGPVPADALDAGTRAVIDTEIEEAQILRFEDPAPEPGNEPPEDRGTTP